MGHIEDWLIVNKIGFASCTTLPTKLQTEWKEENFRLMPRGGVAVQLSRYTEEKPLPYSVDDRHAFCMLPLPVKTGLPAHVNGHFALDHETRRSLWDNKEDARTEWNRALALHVVVPAYLTAVQHARDLLFPDRSNNSGTSHQLELFHKLFPSLAGTVPQVWRSAAEEIYWQLAAQELALFPVIRTDLNTIQWVPAVKKKGQQGLFCDTFRFLKDVAGNTPQTRTMATEFQAVLKSLNMKVLDSTAFEVMENFKQSGVDGVGEVSPEAVMNFLKTAKSGHGDGCNIGNLPCPVENTPFQTAVNVLTCLLFLDIDDDFSDKLEGLPLCLRQTGTLYYFQKTADAQKPIVSSFVSALPGSAEMFLHEKIIKIFQPVTEKTQRLMQELSIPMLAQMLPSLIPPEQFRTGQPCSCTPGLKWLRGIWKFLETQLQTLKGEEGIENRQTIEAEMQCLSEWSLIPVKMRTGGVDQVVAVKEAEQLLLYPVKDMHCVIYLPEKADRMFQKLFEVLKSLHRLPLLNLSELPRSSAATKIVASTSHPAALLHALTSCGVGLTTSPPHALAVLTYFTSCLPVLEELIPNKDLCTKLRKLPFFTTVDGRIVSVPPQANTLCLAHNFPHEGLAQWAMTRQEPLMLLPCSTIPDNLSDFLGFKTPSAVQFYCKDLLPAIATLPKAAVLPHMNFLRGLLHGLPPQEKETVCTQLKATAFLHVDGQLYKAQSFYSILEPVFQHMCPDFFPPAPFTTEDWQTFLKSAGLVVEVTDEMFVRFAQKVQSDADKEITPAVVAKSKALAHHLLQRENLATSCLLQKVRDIRFLCPSEWMDTPDGQFLTQISNPFSPGRLVSFAESCSERHVILVWSSSCVIHPAADPTKLAAKKDDSRWMKEVLNQIGWQKCAPRDKVLQHLHNVCKALTGKEGEERFRGLGADANRLNLLLMVVSKLYEYLEEYLDSEGLAQLKQLPLICDIGRRQMLSLQDVVVDLREEEAIEGYVHKAPNELGKFFNLFVKLGVSQRVTANHYCRVLAQLSAHAKGVSLHVEEMKIVKIAVEGLFRCIKSEDTKQKTLTGAVLFLPSEDLLLIESAKLVFKDDESLGERFKKLQTDANFFLGFKKLEIRVTTPQDEMRLLPEPHQMVWLSKIVREVVPQTIKAKAVEGTEARDLAENLVRPECSAAVIRLAYHQHKHSDKPKTTPFTEDTAEQIMQRLTYISVKDVSGLMTVLEWNGRQVPGSEFKRPSFMETSEKGARSCTLYLDSAESRLTGHSFTSSLALAVQFVLNFDSAYAVHLQVIFENPSQAAAHLDAHNIERFNVGNMEDDSIFPPPGTFIPVNLHCYLDNNICEFYSGEHVGFEVYDPLVDAEGDEEGDAVYIYARVLREVRQDAQGRASLMFRRYLVDLGPERGKVEVHATQLYKFIRKSSPGKPSSAKRSGALTSQSTGSFSGGPSAGAASGASASGGKPSTGQKQKPGSQSTAPEEEESSKPLDMETVLKEIRQTLTEAWKMPDEKDRLRVWKRLLLKWHPDKNPGNTKFCTTVTQMIQQYVGKLKKGQRLGDEDDKKNRSGSQRSEDKNYSKSSGSRGDSKEKSSSYSSKHDKGSSSGGARGSPFGSGSRTGSTGSRPRSDDFFSSFYENMFRRGRSYHRDWERPSGREGDSGWRDTGGFGSGSDWRSSANPQPGEAQRWFRQSEADMTTAQSLSAGGTKGYNWVCYLCFQAVQKALTAVLYHRDANLVPASQSSIMQLAGKVDDPALTDLAKRLEACVGSTKRMRYPGMFSYPHIPDDVYSINDAKTAFEIASQALERVRGLPH